MMLPQIHLNFHRTSEKLWLQVHGIERVDGLVIVGLDLSLLDLLETLICGSHICELFDVKSRLQAELGT
jgi:hypothetical protein